MSKTWTVLLWLAALSGAVALPITQLDDSEWTWPQIKTRGDLQQAWDMATERAAVVWNHSPQQEGTPWANHPEGWQDSHLPDAFYTPFLIGTNTDGVLNHTTQFVWMALSLTNADNRSIEPRTVAVVTGNVTTTAAPLSSVMEELRHQLYRGWYQADYLYNYYVDTNFLSSGTLNNWFRTHNVAGDCPTTPPMLTNRKAFRDLRLNAASMLGDLTADQWGACTQDGEPYLTAMPSNTPGPVLFEMQAYQWLNAQGFTDWPDANGVFAWINDLQTTRHVQGYWENASGYQLYFFMGRAYLAASASGAVLAYADSLHGSTWYKLSDGSELTGAAVDWKPMTVGQTFHWYSRPMADMLVQEEDAVPLPTNALPVAIVRPIGQPNATTYSATFVGKTWSLNMGTGNEAVDGLTLADDTELVTSMSTTAPVQLTKHWFNITGVEDEEDVTQPPTSGVAIVVCYTNLGIMSKHWNLSPRDSGVSVAGRLHSVLLNDLYNGMGEMSMTWPLHNYTTSPRKRNPGLDKGWHSASESGYYKKWHGEACYDSEDQGGCTAAQTFLDAVTDYEWATPTWETWNGSESGGPMRMIYVHADVVYSLWNAGGGVYRVRNVTHWYIDGYARQAIAEVNSIQTNTPAGTTISHSIDWYVKGATNSYAKPWWIDTWITEDAPASATLNYTSFVWLANGAVNSVTSRTETVGSYDQPPSDWIVEPTLPAAPTVEEIPPIGYVKYANNKVFGWQLNSDLIATLQWVFNDYTP